MQEVTMWEYSVVTTVFNDEEEVIQLIKNIEEQTYLPKEMIIVDGGSTDCTVSKVQEYALHSLFPLKILGGERLNIAQGFNKAIREAATDYIGIVACGNYYCKNFFEKLLTDFSKNENILITYSAIRCVGNSEFAQIFASISMGGADSKLFKIASNHGNICKREVFEKYGYFYEKFKYAGEDSEFFLRLKKAGVNMYGDNDVLVEWKIPENYDELKKQKNNYVIADMEMMDNWTFIRGYRGRLLHILCLPTAILFLLIPMLLTRVIGVILCMLFLYKSFKVLFHHNLEYWKIYNFNRFYFIVPILSNWKLFFRKNKIEKTLDTFY